MIRTILQNVINTLADNQTYEVIAANSLAKYGPITKTVVVAGVDFTDSDNTTFFFDICTLNDGLFMYDVFETLKEDLAAIGLFNISAGKPRYDELLKCFILSAFVKFPSVMLSGYNVSEPHTIKYKNYSFLFDITTFKSGFERNIKSYTASDGSAFSLNLGSAGGFVRGEGYLSQGNWENEYDRLNELLNSSTSGTLILPTGDTMTAFLKSFNVFYKKDIGRMQFSFEFITA